MRLAQKYPFSLEFKGGLKRGINPPFTEPVFWTKAKLSKISKITRVGGSVSSNLFGKKGYFLILLILLNFA